MIAVKQIRNLVILGFILFSMAIQGQETFRDNFNTTSYSNNNGSANFSGNWIEFNETTSPTAGRITIAGNQLRFDDLDGVYITRDLDLSTASSATLTFDYDATARGNESLYAYLFNDASGNYEVIAIMNSSITGSISHTLTADQMSSNSSIAFGTASGTWGNNEVILIDNVSFTATFNPYIRIDDIAANENDGTVTFTATHINNNASGAFTVNYSTADGTAIAGSDYTATSGTLNFNGTVGDTESITVNITDDNLFEIAETFTVQFTSTSDVSVDISDTAIGTINDDEIVQPNTPLTLFEEFDGYINYTSAGGTLRTQPNGTNACSVTTTSSGTVTSPIPAGATIDKAYLYWAHSNATPDSQVTFEGTTVNAEYMYTTSITTRVFYGGVSDVTAIINGIANPSTNTYDFSGLTIDTSSTYCSSATVLGGWSLFIFYTDTSLPASTINLYQGFNGESNSSSSFTLDGFFAIGATGSKTSVLSWEGDQTLSNNELLTVTTGLGTFTLAGDGDNNGITVNNPFNSTIFDNTVGPVVNNTTAYGVDLDTYDVSPYIQPGESSVTTNVQSGQDFVIMNALVLKVPSNLVTGRVFEDANYGGGAGRNYPASAGIPLPGVTVELYNNAGTLVETSTTGSNGKYVFAGMANGNYSIRVVNGSVKSTRGGGTACTTCIPIQTFRKDYLLSILTETTNEVGGANPSGSDPGAGTLAGAQSVSSVAILNEGVDGLDFGFNFNTIVNTNENGQGSLEQFIVNSDNLDEISLDIEANGIFDPVSGDDTSIFMIPTAGDPLGRTADANFTGGYFDILISDGNPLSAITDDNTKIDGRTQTAYSGDTNSGTVGSGGTTVGNSATTLPNYALPEIQVHRNTGDVLRTQGSSVVIRNISVYADNSAGIRIEGGSMTVANSLLGVNALGVNAGNINYGVEMTGGAATIENSYISTNAEAGVLVNGGTSTIIQNNHITANGTSACFDNIRLQNGSGIIIQQNLIENAASLGIDGDGISGGVTITENTITNSGQDGGACSGTIANAGILLHGNNSSVSNNIIASNGGAGIVIAGGNTSGNLISQNAIYANGTASDALGIDLDQSNALGDGVTRNDTNDADNGPNGAINFPIISAAYATSADFVVEGWSRPGATIEVFLTDINEGTAAAGDNQLGLSRDYGEGQIYLATFVEGSVSDADPGTGPYLDTDGNTDATNKFRFRVPLSGGITFGNLITATATLSNTTSEFSPFSEIKAYTIITNRRITYRVNKN